MKIVLLPGLDGTGLLFQNLIEYLPQDHEVELVSFELIYGLTYKEQAEELASKYKNEELLIVGESYSGRIAYELYHLLKGNVKGIVFLASFISRPSLLSLLARFVPVSFLAQNVLTESLLYLVGFNRSGDRSLVGPVFSSLRNANKLKLKSRLRNISHLKKPTLDILCPVIYVRPSKDRLVSSSAVKALASKCASYREISIEGGHFIAQVNPVACAKVINSAACM